MKRKVSSLSIGVIYGYVHFAVEVACFYFLFSRISDSPIWWALALLFDALAFVLQGFVGVIADKYGKFPYGLCGCALIVVALVCPMDIPALVMICVGNAFAHIGGAQLTLNSSGGRITPTSIFVGGGSFGVITGQLLAAVGYEMVLLVPIILMLVSIGLLTFVSGRCFVERVQWKIDISAKHSATLIMIVAFVVVAVRAYIAYAIPTEWNKTSYQAVFLFVIMGIGKMAGGFLADGIGYYKTALISSLASLPFLLFGNSMMLLSLIGVGLFSMTMPVTIGILVSKFPDSPCFAFGVTTIALFVGTAPAFFIRPTTLIEHQITVLVLILVATVALLFCIERKKKNDD